MRGGYRPRETHAKTKWSSRAITPWRAEMGVKRARDCHTDDGRSWMGQTSRASKSCGTASKQCARKIYASSSSSSRQQLALTSPDYCSLINHTSSFRSSSSGLAAQRGGACGAAGGKGLIGGMGELARPGKGVLDLYWNVMGDCVTSVRPCSCP